MVYPKGWGSGGRAETYGGVLPTNVWPDRQFKGTVTQSRPRDFAAAAATARVAADVLVRVKISRDGSF
jgi:hypothetical protein